MVETQLSELRSNVRVIDVATAPLLDPTECADVLASCAPDAWAPAKRMGATSADVLADRNIEPFVDPETKSRVEQPLPGGAASPIARRIVERVLEVNRDVFGFRVVGLEDPIRVLGYRGAHADHLREHIDVGPVHPLRKLAFSVLLSDPAQFRGGDLVISGRTFEPARAQGVLTVFPSFIAHRVAPIEEGERHVIVGWVLGPTFV